VAAIGEIDGVGVKAGAGLIAKVILQQTLFLPSGENFMPARGESQSTEGRRFPEREEPPEFRGALGVSDVLSLKLESGYSSGSDYQDDYRDDHDRTDSDYGVNPGRGYRCCRWSYHFHNRFNYRCRGRWLLLYHYRW